MDLRDDADDFDAELCRIRAQAMRAGTDCREELRRLAEGTDDPYCKRRALTSLAEECIRHGDTKTAERMLIEATAVEANNLMSELRLVHFYACSLGQADRALEMLEDILSGKCRIDGNVRHVHMERIRVAIKASRPDIAEESLRILIEFRPAPGTEGLRLERDFLGPLADIGVSAELIKQYDERSRPRAKVPD